MSAPDALDLLFAEDGPIARAVPGYTRRPEQVDLARSILDAFTHEGCLLAEAPCGSGKTLGYAVPAALHARESGRRVIVATSTITLQGQLLDGEVGLAAAACGVRAAKLLGRANYLCLRRAAEALEAGELDASRAALVVAVRAKGGEFELAEAADPEVTELHCDHELCEGSACPHFADCFYFRRRREARQAGVVVMNHALLLAEAQAAEAGGGEDLASGAALVIDEAHRMPEALTSAGSETLSPVAFYRALHAAERAGARAAAGGVEGAAALVAAAREAARLVEPLFLSPARRRSGAAAPAGPARALATDRDAGRFATDGAARLAEAMRGLAALADTLPPSFALGRAAEACLRLAARLERFREPGRDAFLWVDRDGGPAFHLAPFRVDGLFRALVTSRARGLALVSGTLSLGGDFGFLKSALDLRDTVDLSFSADFERGLDRVLYVAEDLPSPKEGGFYPALAGRLEDLLLAVPGKALVLFTSLSLMRSAADDLRVPLLSAGLTLLVQGEAGRAELLRRFRREPGGVLFASVSFWEGVDVREHPIRNLVITRLPFQPPDDPVVAARSARLKGEGGEPFRDLFIPAAALKIRQGIGRLTRDRAAWGVVSVLDSRLRTERYGRLLMPAFGGMKVVTGLDDVRAFAAGRS